jgi:type IV secretory pathway VirB10-like protein
MSTTEPEVQTEVTQTERPRMTEEEYAAYKERRAEKQAAFKAKKAAEYEERKARREAAAALAPETSTEANPDEEKPTRAKKSKKAKAAVTGDEQFDAITALYKKDAEYKAFIIYQTQQYKALKGKNSTQRAAVYTAATKA